MKEILGLIKFWILAVFLIKLVELMPEPSFLAQSIVIVGAPFILLIATAIIAFADAEKELREEKTQTSVTNNYYIVDDQKRRPKYLQDLNVIDVEGIEMK